MKCININKRLGRKGISLAEVMLALVIIGSIASFTIPTLLQNVQDQYLKILFKETYSLLTQASSKVLTDNSGSIIGTCTDHNSNCFKNLYAPYFSTIKNCPAPAVGNCWASDGAYYLMEGTPLNWNMLWTGETCAGLILANGAYVAFTFRASDCKDQHGSMYSCGAIDIDTNGAKGPNKYGKDLFEIWQTKDSIKPVGIQGDTFETSCSAGDYGYGCAALYLRQ